LPVVRQRLDLGVDFSEMLDHSLNQFFAERIVLPRLLAILEEYEEVICEILRRVETPRVEKLERRDAPVPPLHKLGLAHRDNVLRSAAISSAAAANSAPRLIRPVQRARACAEVFATSTPLITGT